VLQCNVTVVEIVVQERAEAETVHCASSFYPSGDLCRYYSSIQLFVFRLPWARGHVYQVFGSRLLSYSRGLLNFLPSVSDSDAPEIILKHFT
jgi:hypothetical protein